MNALDSKFWKAIAVMFVFSIFFLAYSILSAGPGRESMLPQKACASDILTPGGGYFAQAVGTNTQDAAMFIWKYDANGVPVSVSVAYRQKDWVSSTYEIKPEDKK